MTTCSYHARYPRAGTGHASCTCTEFDGPGGYEPQSAEAAAYTLGRQHGEAGRTWDTNADDSPLMTALGEHEPTTAENADQRARISDAYNEGIADTFDDTEFDDEWAPCLVCGETTDQTLCEACR